MRNTGAWSEETDPQTGSTFYYNVITQESRWERPAVMPGAVSASNRQNSSNQQPSQQQAHKSSLANLVPTLIQAKRKWLALVDSSTGSTYYVDEASGASQWEKPPDSDGDQARGDYRTAGFPQEEAPDITKEEGAVPEEPNKDGNGTRVVPANIDFSVKGDAVLLKPMVYEIGTGVKPSEEVEGKYPTYDDDGNASTSASKPLLQRADSNSTMSTYGGELDSLAKYVTGHSTTLNRETVVELENSKQEGEDRGSTADIDEDTLRSTNQETSDDGNRSTSKSESENDEEGTSKPSTLVVHGSSLEIMAPSLSDGVGFSSQDGILPGVDRRQTQLREIATDSSSPSSTRSTSKPRGVDVAVDGVNRSTPVSQFPHHNEGGRGVPCGQASFRLKEDSEEGDDHSPSFSAKSNDTAEDAGTVSTAEGSDGADNGRRQPSRSSLRSPTREVVGATKLLREIPAENSSATSDTLPPQASSDISSGNAHTGGANKLHQEMPSKYSSAISDTIPPQASSYIFSNNSHTVEPVEATVRSGGGKPSDVFGAPAGTTAAVVTQPRSSFDSVAVAAVALQRLQAGMLLRRRKVAVVKLQAHARGWAARGVHARLMERRETRRREEWEAKQRAAQVIQAVIRGRAARGEAQRARKQRELDSQRQRSSSTGGHPVEDTRGSYENTDEADDEPDIPNAGAKKRAAAVIQVAVRGRAARARAEAQRAQTQFELDSQRQQKRSTAKSLVADTSRSFENTDEAGRCRDTENFNDEPHSPSAVGVPQLAPDEHIDLNVAIEMVVSQETSEQIAVGSSNIGRPQEELRDIQEHKQEIIHTISDEGYYHDAMHNRGPQTQSREVGLIFPDEGEHQDNSSMAFDCYGNSGGGFLSDQLETIHEEEHQRNDHLLCGRGGEGEGGGGEHSAEGSSSNELRPLAVKYTATNPSPEWSGLILKADMAGSSPDGSDSSDDGFDEGSTGEVVYNNTDSNGDRYSSGRPTSASSESTAARGGEVSSDLTVDKDSDDGGGSVSEDSYFRRSSDQHSTTSEEEERVQQQRQPCLGTMLMDDDETFKDGGHVQDVVDTHHHDNHPETDADETEHGGEERASLEQGIEEEKVGEGIYQDTTAPQKRLEILRRLVASQAQAAARVTMTAAGTDASRRELSRIR